MHSFFPTFADMNEYYVDHYVDHDAAFRAGDLEECKRICAENPDRLNHQTLQVVINHNQPAIIEWMLNQNLELLFDEQIRYPSEEYCGNRILRSITSASTFFLIKKSVYENLASSNLNANAKIILLCEILLCEIANMKIGPESDTINHTFQTIFQLASEKNNIGNWPCHCLNLPHYMETTKIRIFCTITLRQPSSTTY